MCGDDIEHQQGRAEYAIGLELEGRTPFQIKPSKELAPRKVKSLSLVYQAKLYFKQTGGELLTTGTGLVTVQKKFAPCSFFDFLLTSHGLAIVPSREGRANDLFLMELVPMTAILTPEDGNKVLCDIHDAVDFIASTANDFLWTFSNKERDLLMPCRIIPAEFEESSSHDGCSSVIRSDGYHFFEKGA